MNNASPSPVVITGGASGIGRAAAQRFAALGATVTIIDRTDPAQGVVRFTRGRV